MEALGLTLSERCAAVEECYEFLLAYAAQGVSGDSGGANAGPLRTLLVKAEEALSGIKESCLEAIVSGRLEPPDPYRAFVEVLDRDARDTLAALRLVMAQPSISSQLVDNFNASIHVRALLTDLFLIDEVLKERTPRTPPPALP